MCARSQASGLISSEWAVSTCSSENGATMSSVRRRTSARASAIWVAVGTGTVVQTLRSSLRGDRLLGACGGRVGAQERQLLAHLRDILGVRGERDVALVGL